MASRSSRSHDRDHDHDHSEEGNSESEDGTVTAWADRLAALAGDGGGCLETAQAAATERATSRRDLITGALSTAAGVGVLGSLAGSLTVDSTDESIVGISTDNDSLTAADVEAMAVEWIDIDDDGDAESGDADATSNADAMTASGMNVPFRPTTKPNYHCTGTPNYDRLAAAMTSSFGCWPCQRRPSPMTCMPCVSALIAGGYLSGGSCCDGGTWRKTF
jgi:hypothetical protein